MRDPGFTVKVDNLSRNFKTFKAVDNISFSVQPGEIFGFLGANGAGKTTTIRMLCGLLLPSSGRASVLGFDVYRQSEDIKRNIGYMSQKFSLYPDLTLRENIEFYGGVYGLTTMQIRSKTNELLDHHQLRAMVDTLTGLLPLGWKQRLSLGVALLHDPAVLFLDEPTSGVDPVARREFWLQIYDLSRRGKTIFVTTHYMDEAEFCGRVSIMKDGRIIAIDNPSALKTTYHADTMQQVFLAAVGAQQ